MSAIDDLFTRLKAEGRKAFIPFVAAGDPDLDFTARLLTMFDAAGASLCEVGIPYSDPIADGPVIQDSYARALDRGATLGAIFEMLGSVTPQLAAPVVTMVSYAIVYRRGVESFISAAQDAGAAGAIVPDLPVEEADVLAAECRRRDFSLIQLITPTTPRDRAVKIAETSTGFLYYVSITGITGERNELPADLVENVNWLRQQTSVPVCIGFGISQPEHVRRLAPVADGLIVGSGIMRRVAKAAQGAPDEVLSEVRTYIESLLAAFDG